MMKVESSSRHRWSALALISTALIVAAWSYQGGGIVAILFDPRTAPQDRVQAIRSYFEAWGLAAPLVYVGLVVLETVIAPLPGILLYLPGGAIFGWALGGSASLVGNILGSGIACTIARRIAGARMLSFFDGPTLSKYKGTVETRGFWIVLLLRLNPLTSSDIVSYAAGLTKLPTWQVMTATAIGMAPLCFLQAYFAQEVFTVFPVLIYPLTLVVVVYFAYIVKITTTKRVETETGGPMAKKIIKSEDEWK